VPGPVLPVPVFPCCRCPRPFPRRHPAVGHAAVEDQARRRRHEVRAILGQLLVDLVVEGRVRSAE
jgi:hypothetical protein